MATTTSSKTLADYAAIAVAPLLIFLMINSLANYLMLVLYHGGYPERVSWTLFMYTMGVVSVARIAIERDRSYAMGYLCILGAVTFLAMMRFVGSPIFSLFMLALIAFLADRIVHDCTLIDDSVDASGQGLMDSGGHFVRRQVEANRAEVDSQEAAADDVPNTKAQTPQARQATHQPGRTVMYLALAALPLFGLGQFFLRADPGTTSRALWLLAIYLFSSFSLLVTTSFLGLRRYLRQRGVDMPNNVSVGWITGGLAIISLILLVSYLAPVPGQVLASFELPEITNPPDDLSASKYGHGNEAAAKKKEGAAVTGEDKNAGAKEVQETASQKGAPPGAAAEGDNKQGAAGKQDGGKKPASGGSDSDQKGSEEKSSGDNGKQENSQASDDPNSKQGDKQDSKQNESGQQSQDNKTEESRDGDPDQPPQSESQQTKSNESEAEQSESEESNARESDSEQADSEQAESPPSASPPSSAPSLMEMFSLLGSLLKFLIALALAVVVGVYVYRNRDAILQWFNGLWFRQSDSSDMVEPESSQQVVSAPVKPFSSFRNPIGVEKDPRQIVIVTFQAFEAWAREQGSRRRPDETPSEFLKRIAGTLPQVSSSAVRVVDAYNRIVYGDDKATQADISAADQIWKQMNSAVPATVR
ncbi:signal peptide protein [Rhodopirellula maiorica SM1]|uniref:Signal peptide protein n=1 Tax=Rhodopirellula maiorica SM1 TaxID=1265738 RepID=M5RHC0_9BACT|nr:DUF4129 domain-containing protein [Rhodopirellula maiorica]EMI18566.1 signal peptide protein [Rhodopirellula maiorica SM1]